MESFLFVLGAGIEPACLSARDFKSLVATSYTTRALHNGGNNSMGRRQNQVCQRR